LAQPKEKLRLGAWAKLARVGPYITKMLEVRIIFIAIISDTYRVFQRTISSLRVSLFQFLLVSAINKAAVELVYEKMKSKLKSTFEKSFCSFSMC
jgi:hypothetical protein